MKEILEKRTTKSTKLKFLMKKKKIADEFHKFNKFFTNIVTNLTNEIPNAYN